MAFTLPKPLKDLLTGPDGTTYDAMRVAFLFGVGTFLMLSGVDLFAHKHPFNPVSFGTGFAAITGGTGAGIAIKQIAKSEPPAKE